MASSGKRVSKPRPSSKRSVADAIHKPTAASRPSDTRPTSTCSSSPTCCSTTRCGPPPAPGTACSASSRTSSPRRVGERAPTSHVPERSSAAGSSGWVPRPSSKWRTCRVPTRCSAIPRICRPNSTARADDLWPVALVEDPTNVTSAGGDHFAEVPRDLAATVSTERVHSRSALPASSACGMTPDQGLFCVHGAAWAQSSR